MEIWLIFNQTRNTCLYALCVYVNRLTGFIQQLNFDFYNRLPYDHSSSTICHHHINTISNERKSNGVDEELNRFNGSSSCGSCLLVWLLLLSLFFTLALKLCENWATQCPCRIQKYTVHTNRQPLMHDILSPHLLLIMWHPEKRWLRMRRATDDVHIKVIIICIKSTCLCKLNFRYYVFHLYAYSSRTCACMSLCLCVCLCVCVCQFSWNADTNIL